MGIPVGLLLAALAGLLMVISLVRRAGDKIDFADSNLIDSTHRLPGSELAPSTFPPASTRVWGKRPFKTAGNVVLLCGISVVGVEAALLALVLRL